MRQKISIAEERILREHIRLVIREGEIPRSNPVNIGRASQGYTPIGMPGSTIIKAVGVLIALNWAHKYVGADCISNISALGMPLPKATVALGVLRGEAAVGAAAGAVGAHAPDLKQAAIDYAKALAIDIDGDSSLKDDLYHQSGGLNGIFNYVEEHVAVWPENRVDFNQLTGSPIWPISTQGVSEFDKVCVFIHSLMNRQCENSVDEADTINIVKKELVTRVKYLEFVRTYIKTCFDDYDKMIKEHKQVLDEKKITLNSATVAKMNSVQPKYLSASRSIK